MAVAHAQSTKHTWPIVYGHRTRRAPGGGTGLAWALFLGLGFPFGLMAVLTVLAGGGVYVGLFPPLLQPRAPDLLQPIPGVAVFVRTPPYLPHPSGWRPRFRPAAHRRAPAAGPLPPPPPPDHPHR